MIPRAPTAPFALLLHGASSPMGKARLNGFLLLFLATAPSACSNPAQASAAAGASVDAGPADAGTSAVDPGPVVDTAPWCNQTLLGYAPPATAGTIAPRRPIRPFYQWQSNNGYCGEVSLLQAGMNNGLWASQFNVRSLCGFQSQGDDGFPKGTPLSQSGPDGYCAANTNSLGVASAEVGSQLLIDNADASRGQNSVLTCANNAGLAAVRYITPSSLDGQGAFQDFVVWVKKQIIAGHWVTAGVLTPGGKSDEYDHIVSIMSVGTNHAVTDSAYYADDVFTFDDHGAYTFDGTEPIDNPATPPGAVPGSRRCTPYVFGVRVGDLAKTRASLNALSTGQPYAIALPKRSTNGHSLLDYAFAVTGPLDDDGTTLPVVVSIAKASTNGVDNPRDPKAGYQYEAPYVGTSDKGDSCTNAPPTSWMDLQLRVEVEGLTAGKKYNLYRYIFDAVTAQAGTTPVGTHVALAVPRAGFNGNRASATSAVTFTATGSTYAETLALRSDRIAVFRAVPVEAP